VALTRPESRDLAASPSIIAVSAVRSTLILSSMAAIRSAGLFERYVTALQPAARDELLGTIAGTWLPVQTALQHYLACDALSLPAEDQMRLGRCTGTGIKRHLTRAATMLAHGTGVGPLVILEHFPRFWSRSFHGGGIALTRLGPKDVELRYVACVLLRSPYFRSALRGVAVGLLEHVTRGCVMKELSWSEIEDCARYRLSWV
jgi:hypothetical protein